MRWREGEEQKKREIKRRGKSTTKNNESTEALLASIASLPSCQESPHAVEGKASPSNIGDIILFHIWMQVNASLIFKKIQTKGHRAFGHHIAELRGFMDDKRLQMRELPQKIGKRTPQLTLR